MLSGHARPLTSGRGGAPGHPTIDATLAEVRVERDGIMVARGSAVVIAARDEDGEPACYVLTVGHVLSGGGDPGAAIVVFLPGEDGRRPVPAEPLEQVDRGDRDLAVLRTVAPHCQPAPIGPPLADGADVWLAGFPAIGMARVAPGHVRDGARTSSVSWSVDGDATEGTSGGGIFDAQSGGLVGLIQGYWAVRLVGPGGTVAGEAPAGRIAVVPIARVRDLLEEWGYADLLGE